MGKRRKQKKYVKHPCLLNSYLVASSYLSQVILQLRLRHAADLARREGGARQSGGLERQPVDGLDGAVADAGLHLSKARYM